MEDLTSSHHRPVGPRRVPRPRWASSGQAALIMMMAIVAIFAFVILAALALSSDGCEGPEPEHTPTPDRCAGYTTQAYYPDADGDNFGAVGSQPVYDCERPAGYSCDATDCDDARASVNPGSAELCDNGVDDNCDGEVDGVAEGRDVYTDEDGDGIGGPGGTVTIDALCGVVPDGTTEDGRDCDDQDASRHPGAAELDDGVDQDCDERVDEGVASASWAGGTSLGTAVASPGDVNGDGFEDILVGADRDQGGTVTLVYGEGQLPIGTSMLPPTATTFSADTSASLAGEELLGLGDIDGDGVNDFAIGAPTWCPAGSACGGAVYVFYGRPGGGRWPASVSMSTADLLLTGPALSGLGSGLAAGDFDGDGHRDLVVGAPAAETGAGRAWVLFGTGSRREGRLALHQTEGVLELGAESGGLAFGFSMASVGDFDADGFEDLLVGAPGSDGGRGAVKLFYGGARGVTLQNFTWTASTRDGALFGSSVVGGLDLDLDGHIDLAVGAPGACSAAELCGGMVFVGFGSGGRPGEVLSTSDLYPAIFVGTGHLDSVGISLAAGRLAEGPGPADTLFIGAPFRDGEGPDVGAVYRIDPRDRHEGQVKLRSEQLHFSSIVPGGQAGASIAWWETTDGATALIGAPFADRLFTTNVNPLPTP